MNKILLCNVLFMKRSLKKLSFILLLILMVLLCYLLKNRITEEGNSLTAGIYVEVPGEKTSEITTSLIENYDSVSFYMCDSLSELKEKVATNEYECGYVFDKDFEENLKNNNLDEIVDVYYSPATFLTSMTNEYVFSEIFKEYAFNEMVAFISDKDMFHISDVNNLKDELRPSYDSYINSDDTFSFEYIDSENKTIDNSKIMSSYILLSIKGLVALFIMFAGFIGTFNLYKDEKVHVFRAFSKSERMFCKMSEIFSISIIASIVGFITLLLCRQLDNIGLEIIRFLLYACICTIYCFVLHKLVSNSYAFAALIPILVLGSIIFCPIFIDISDVIPMAKYVSYAFLPKYFFL